MVKLDLWGSSKSPRAGGTFIFILSWVILILLYDICQFDTVKIKIMIKYKENLPGIWFTDATGTDAKRHLH